MAKKPLPSPDELRQLLDYDPETGVLTWKPRNPAMFEPTAARTAEHACSNWNARWAGKPAFTSLNALGYARGNIFGSTIKAHRAAWAIVHGRWPDELLDHINGDPSDNRLSNLREATFSENQQNRTINKRNKSGFPGVSFDRAHGKWQAGIGFGLRKKHLGRFDSAEEAGRAYAEAKRKFHPFAPEVRR